MCGPLFDKSIQNAKILWGVIKEGGRERQKARKFLTDTIMNLESI